jgi:hypothetical protein
MYSFNTIIIGILIRTASGREKWEGNLGYLFSLGIFFDMNVFCECEVKLV